MPSPASDTNTTPGATYDAIEGRFRIIKKDAQKLKSEIDNGDRAPAPARGATASTNNEATPKTPRAKKTNGNGTPTTARKDKVIAGRVNKNVATPRKGVKVEGINGEDYLMMDDGIENGNGNMVMGVKAEVDSSGSSFFGGEEDAVGEVVNGWTYGDLGI